MAKGTAKTPLMRQYHTLKQQAPDALLLFHLGDFFELFYDDAIVAARDLEITLTSRNKEKGEPVPMCGVFDGHGKHGAALARSARDFFVRHAETALERSDGSGTASAARIDRPNHRSAWL